MDGVAFVVAWASAWPPASSKPIAMKASNRIISSPHRHREPNENASENDHGNAYQPRPMSHTLPIGMPGQEQHPNGDEIGNSQSQPGLFYEYKRNHHRQSG